jgi:2,5-diamino-6-(ribosylamino)-4(3H)-pyrimidinone 5'-phosphate reductase
MTNAKAKRPRVICHMAASIDGRIVVDGWPEAAARAVRKQYEQVHASYEADGWICGRVTMEPFAKQVRSEETVKREAAEGPSLRSGRDDFTALTEVASLRSGQSYAFAIDASGRLDWQSNDIEGDHVVAILSQRVSDEYLSSLRERGVSYILAGEQDVDLGAALEKIGERFGVRTLMLEGGGRINGGFLRAGLVDEVSLLVAPVVDGRMGTPALFDEEDAAPWPIVLESVEQRADGVLWLRYRVEGHPT